MYRASMLMVLLLLLSGCRIELNLDEGRSSGTVAQSTQSNAGGTNIQEDEPLSVYLNGDVEYNETEITLILHTELQKGTLLNVILREYSKDASLKGIADGSVDPVEAPVYEGTIEAETKDITLPIKREEDKVYTLSVEFKPEIQPDSLKEVYGERGENIVIASNIHKYEHEGQTMIGVKASSYIGYPPGWGYLE
ncbi:hypothetical protein [Bacillus sp. AK031]